MPDSTILNYVGVNVVGNTWGDGTIGRVSQVKVDSVAVAEYDYLGLDRVVRTDLPEPDYYRTLSDASNYDRLDRFGRITTDVWTADRSTDLHLYSVSEIAYDSNSNITDFEDDFHPSFGHAYQVDALNRLVDAQRGVVASGSISDDLWQETWDVSQTGNWLGHDLDLNGDGDQADADELLATNTFSLANEWSTRDTNSSSPVEATLVYDEVGNLTDDDEAYEYVYDPFGRLRQIRETGTSDLVAEYRYNGLNQRIASHFDVDEDATVETVADGDPWWYFAFDARWRTVARAVERDGSTPAIVEQWVHHHAGLAESGSSSYIDSVILRDRDTAASPDGTLDERVYYLQNWRADLVALISDAGAQLEQVRYEPYGTPFGLPAGDINADGQVTQADANQAGVWYLAPAYDVRSDIDMDGDLDVTDLSAIAAARDNIDTLARGGLSLYHNRKGYAGYEHLAELAGAKWDVRNRVLIGELGTWNRRDPLGYVDGMSLYAYAVLVPLMSMDPFGLTSTNAAIDDDEPTMDWEDIFDYIRSVLQYGLPDEITLPLGPTEAAPDITKIWICDAYHKYLQEHLGDPGYDEESDPTAQWLKMLCRAAQGNLNVRMVCCEDAIWVKGVKYRRAIVHRTYCPTTMTAAACCAKVPFKILSPPRWKTGTPIPCNCDRSQPGGDWCVDKPWYAGVAGTGASCSVVSAGTGTRPT